MLTGIVGTGVLFYEDVTYSFEYDSNYRVTRSLFCNTEDNTIVFDDLHFTYSEGHISAVSHSDDLTIECTLDNEGRIINYVRTSVLNDTLTDISHFEFTYDAEGHLVTQNTFSQDQRDNSTVNYVWEGDELLGTSMGDGQITVEFETSDAPAQAMFSRLDYDNELWPLCAQGCFGKLPAHMPSKSTVTTHLPIPGMPDMVKVSNYTYTVDANGRLATMEEVEEFTNDSNISNYTFSWEER